jgi:DNA-binding winged helix-turn-helix (wHTH) protein
MNRRRSTGIAIGPPGRLDPSPSAPGLRSAKHVAERLHFDRFTLDTGTRELMADGAIVHLSPKAFDLLEILVQKRPEAVPRAELEKRIWRATHVSDTSLAGLVGELRKALGDQERPARFVRTVHSFGYAFCGTASPVRTAARAVESPSAHLLILGRREIALVPGENVLGREAGAVVWLESASVSRRHARIVIQGETATLEDLGSRNGTRVGDREVKGAVPLADGDVIHLGSVMMTFRVVPAGETEDAK